MARPITLPAVCLDTYIECNQRQPCTSCGLCLRSAAACPTVGFGAICARSDSWSTQAEADTTHSTLIHLAHAVNPAARRPPQQQPVTSQDVYHQVQRCVQDCRAASGCPQASDHCGPEQGAGGNSDVGVLSRRACRTDHAAITSCGAATGAISQHHGRAAQQSAL